MHFILIGAPPLFSPQAALGVKIDMALLKYFKSSSSLPSAKDTGIGEMATKEANVAVSLVLAKKQSQQLSSSLRLVHPKVKRKYTSFSAEQRASIGRYAAEHGEEIKLLYIII